MLIRSSFLGLASLILVFGAARASASFPPTFPNSTIPACFSLVGTDGSTASALGTFEVVVRDLANNPMPGLQVTVDLSNALEMRLCAQQTAPGVLVDCPSSTARSITDTNGRVWFTLVGGGVVGPGSGLNAARIYADGILLGSPTVSTYDLDSTSGVGANDMSIWLGDFGTGQNLGRGDYDCSGSLGANDFSLWLSAFGSGAQSVSCAASCP